MAPRFMDSRPLSSSRAPIKTLLNWSNFGHQFWFDFWLQKPRNAILIIFGGTAHDVLHVLGLHPSKGAHGRQKEPNVETLPSSQKRERVIAACWKLSLRAVLLTPGKHKGNRLCTEVRGVHMSSDSKNRAPRSTKTCWGCQFLAPNWCLFLAPDLVPPWMDK